MSLTENIGMALAGNYPRSSVRALIVNKGKVLCNRCEKEGKTYYLLPGGGQEFQEDLFASLRRECLEELGCQVEVHELVFVYDYIASKDPNTVVYPQYHGLHHVFWCDLKDPENLGKNTLMDTNQTGMEWIPFNKLEELNFLPKQLIPSITNPKDAKIYLGNLI